MIDSYYAVIYIQSLVKIILKIIHLFLLNAVILCIFDSLLFKALIT